MIEIISQVMIAVTGIISVYAVASLKPKMRMYAGISGLIGEPFWLMTAYNNDQWGVGLLALVYTYGWLLVISNNYKEEYL